MAITNLDWLPTELINQSNMRMSYLGYDIHVLRNSVATEDLRNHLWVE